MNGLAITSMALLRSVIDLPRSAFAGCNRGPLDETPAGFKGSLGGQDNINPIGSVDHSLTILRHLFTRLVVSFRAQLTSAYRTKRVFRLIQICLARADRRRGCLTSRSAIEVLDLRLGPLIATDDLALHFSRCSALKARALSAVSLDPATAILVRHDAMPVSGRNMVPQQTCRNGGRRQAAPQVLLLCMSSVEPCPKRRRSSFLIVRP